VQDIREEEKEIRAAKARDLKKKHRRAQKKRNRSEDEAEARLI